MKLWSSLHNMGWMPKLLTGGQNLIPTMNFRLAQPAVLIDINPVSELDYINNGQLLNASLMDYLWPTATDVPHIEIGHVETLSPLNPLGIKGTGEARSIPTGWCAFCSGG